MANRRQDSELIAATLAGRLDAFGELMARHKQAVFGVAFEALGEFEAAQDATQETFIKAYLSLPKLRDPERFRPWLYRIARHTALNLSRGRRRETPLEALCEVADSKPTPQERVEQAELAGQVNDALATLTKPTRLAVILQAIAGYSEEEIAQFLGTSPGALRTRLSRAKRRLKEEMIKTMGETLKNAADQLQFVDQFMSGVVAAIRAFGPPTASRMKVEGDKENWTEMWVEKLRSQMKAHPNEICSWLLNVGQGNFTGFSASLIFLSEESPGDAERIAALAQALATPQKVRLLLRLSGGDAVAGKTLTSEFGAAAPADLELLEQVGLISKSADSQYALTQIGARVLCLLAHINVAFAPVPDAAG